MVGASAEHFPTPSLQSSVKEGRDHQLRLENRSQRRPLGKKEASFWGGTGELESQPMKSGKPRRGSGVIPCRLQRCILAAGRSLISAEGWGKLRGCWDVLKVGWNLEVKLKGKMTSATVIGSKDARPPCIKCINFIKLCTRILPHALSNLCLTNACYDGDGVWMLLEFSLFKQVKLSQV